MSATESLAAVDTICVDKTGTLTDGELRLLGVEVAEGVEAGGGPRGAGPLRRQRRRPQPHPGGDRRALPRRGGPGQRRGPVLLGVEVERPAVRRRRSYVLGAPDMLERGRGADAAARACSRKLEQETASGPAGRRLRRVDRGAARRPRRRGPPPRADSRWRWSCSRRRCAPTPPRRSPSCARRKST